MGNGIIGKILYYWIFIIGALIFAKVFNFIHSDKQVIIFLIAVSVVYIVWTVFRAKGKRRNEQRQAEAQSNVVHKGNGKKKRRK